MTRIIRTAFGLEAAANIFGAIPMFLFPTSILSMANAHPTSPSPISASMLQWLAALILGLTPQLILGMRRTPQAILSRRMVYITLLAGEGALVAVMGVQGLFGGQITGLKKETLQLCAGTLILTAVWRVLVLWIKPEWLGEEEAYEGVEEQAALLDKKTE